MNPAKRALEATIDYLNGHHSVLLAYDSNDLEVGFFNTPVRYIDENFDLKAQVQSLLNVLDVPHEMQEKYLNSNATVLGLLNILSDRAKKNSPTGNTKLDEFIKKVENFQLIKTLEFFTKHLNDSNTKQDLLQYMTSYDKKMDKVNKDFYVTTINSDPHVLQAVENVLESLGIDKQKWGRYTGSSLTIYAMLKEVAEYTAPENEEKLIQLKTLVEAIKTKSKLSWQKAVLYGLAVLFPIVASIPFGGGGVIEQIVTASLFAPVVGLSAALGVGAYSLYQTTFNRNIHVLDKLRDNFLIIAGTCLKVAAYGLVIAAVATGLPVAAILTAAAEGVGLLREGFKLLQMQFKGKVERILTGDQRLVTKQQNARFDAEFSKNKNLLWVNVGVAVALTAIAAVSCFVSGGAIVVASALAMVVTFVAQWRINKYIEKINEKKLHATFTHLEAEDESNIGLQEGLSNQNTQLAKLQTRSGINQDNEAGNQDVQSDPTIANSSDSSGYNSNEESTPATPFEEDAEGKHPLRIL